MYQLRALQAMEEISRTRDLESQEVAEEILDAVGMGLILDLRGDAGINIVWKGEVGSFASHCFYTDGTWAYDPWVSGSPISILEYARRIRDHNQKNALRVNAWKYQGMSELVVQEIINMLKLVAGQRLEADLELDRVIHEKVFVARVLYENSYDEKSGLYRTTFRECFNALIEGREVNSAVIRWFYVFAEGADWEEQLYDVVRAYIPFPECPSEFRYDSITPWESKLENPEFLRYYNEYRELGEALMKKYESIFKGVTDNWEKQGKKGTNPYQCFPDRMIPGAE